MHPGSHRRRARRLASHFACHASSNLIGAQTTTSGYPCSRKRRRPTLICPIAPCCGTRESDANYAPGLIIRLHSALDTPDDFVQLKAAQILTVLLSAEPNPISPHYLQPFLSTLASFVQGVQTNKRDVAVQCLEALLPRAECRKAVWAIPGVIAGLVCK